MAAAHWGDGAELSLDAPAEYPETAFLAIDSSRARTELGMPAPWPIERAVGESMAWYKAVLDGGDAWALTQSQIADHESDCRRAASEAAA
jgi:hypothetical protein